MNNFCIFSHDQVTHDITVSEPPHYFIGIFTDLKLYHADAIHNFKWVKIIRTWQMEVSGFEILLTL